MPFYVFLLHTLPNSRLACHPMHHVPDIHALHLIRPSARNEEGQILLRRQQSVLKGPPWPPKLRSKVALLVWKHRFAQMLLDVWRATHDYCDDVIRRSSPCKKFMVWARKLNRQAGNTFRAFGDFGKDQAGSLHRKIRRSSAKARCCWSFPIGLQQCVKSSCSACVMWVSAVDLLVNSEYPIKWMFVSFGRLSGKLFVTFSWKLIAVKPIFSDDMLRCSSTFSHHPEPELAMPGRVEGFGRATM